MNVSQWLAGIVLLCCTCMISNGHYLLSGLTFITLQPEMWFDGALTGQMSNPPVLHSSEGQKNEMPGSVVSHCWPWLQVIKALLSFCQSSDSPNISPWLIWAVSSVRAYTKPWKDQHPVPMFAVHLSIPSSKKKKNTEIYLDIILFGLASVYHQHIILSYIEVPCECRAESLPFCTDWTLRFYCGLKIDTLWFCQVVLELI